MPSLSLIELSIIDHSALAQGFNDRCLIGLASAAPNPETLKMRECNQLTQQGYASLAAKCPRLSDMDISYPPHYINMAQMLTPLLAPSLHTLYILCSSRTLTAQEIQELREVLLARGRSLQKVTLKFASELNDLVPTSRVSFPALTELVLNGRKYTWAL